MSTKLIFVAVVFKFAIAISLNSVFMYFTIDCKSTHRFLSSQFRTMWFIFSFFVSVLYSSQKHLSV